MEFHEEFARLDVELAMHLMLQHSFQVCLFLDLDGEKCVLSKELGIPRANNDSLVTERDNMVAKVTELEGAKASAD